MITAFQPDAFQTNAWQILIAVILGIGKRRGYRHKLDAAIEAEVGGRYKA